MKLQVKRIAKKSTYTIGRLYIDGKYFCDVLEDKDRGLTQSTPLNEIAKIKVSGQTAIPTGKYNVTLNIISPKFSKKLFYKDYANKGRLPRLLNVPGFDGILLHCGNTDKDSSGCLILGENKVVGQVINSLATFKKLYPILLSAKNGITIEII